MSRRHSTTENGSQPRIAAILLAAGESKRMGTTNKLLLKVGDKTLVRRSLEVLLEYRFADVIVVTGFESPLVAAEISKPEARIIENAKFATGMHSSIRASLENFDRNLEGFLICLSDQPRLSLANIELLAKEFLRLQGPRIVFPLVDGVKGHPTLISTHFISEILAEPDGDYGCNYLIHRHPQFARPLSLQDHSLIEDVDTPEEYSALQDPP